MIFGSDYLTVLNPDFVTDLVKEYLLYAPTEPVQQGQALPPGEKTLNCTNTIPLLFTYKNYTSYTIYFFSFEASFIDFGNSD